MTVFVITLAVFALAMIGMGVGVLLGGRRLRGSCGGLGVDCDDERRANCRYCGREADEGEMLS